jgi:ATP-binding cassette, subfamily G (WHITE), member 4
MFFNGFAVPSETRVFQREYSNNWYSVEAYYLAKLCAELPLQLICPILCIAVSYYMTGQPMELNRFLMVLGVCVIQGLIAQSIGLVAGAVFSLQLGIFFVPAFCIPMLIFSGFFIKIRELFVCLRPIARLSFYKFSFENIIIAVMGFDRKKLHCSEDFCYFKSPKNFMEIMDIQESNFNYNVGMLILWYFGLQICLYVALKMKVRKY